MIDLPKPGASDIYLHSTRSYFILYRRITFSIVGYFNNHKMNVVFNKNKIPDEIYTNL